MSSYCVCPGCNGGVYGQFMKKSGCCCPMACPLNPPPPPIQSKLSPCFRQNIFGNYVYNFGSGTKCCGTCGFLYCRREWNPSTKICECYRRPKKSDTCDCTPCRYRCKC